MSDLFRLMRQPGRIDDFAALGARPLALRSRSRRCAVPRSAPDESGVAAERVRPGRARRRSDHHEAGRQAPTPGSATLRHPHHPEPLRPDPRHAGPVRPGSRSAPRLPCQSRPKRTVTCRIQPRGRFDEKPQKPPRRRHRSFRCGFLRRGWSLVAGRRTSISGSAAWSTRCDSPKMLDSRFGGRACDQPRASASRPKASRHKDSGATPSQHQIAPNFIQYFHHWLDIKRLSMFYHFTKTQRSDFRERVGTI